MQEEMKLVERPAEMARRAKEEGAPQGGAPS